MERSISHYHRFADRHHLPKLGSGVVSTVYALSNQTVLKVATYDDQWPEYISWAKARGYEGGFAPRVYALRGLTQGYVAVVERLKGTCAELGHDPRSYCGGPENSAWMEFQEEVEATFRRHDIHAKNIMLREDNSPVLVDAVWGNSPSKSYRIRWPNSTSSRWSSPLV